MPPGRGICRKLEVIMLHVPNLQSGGSGAARGRSAFPVRPTRGSAARYAGRLAVVELPGSPKAAADDVSEVRFVSQ